ncbi:hypothetical protein [Succinatimonas hippei]|uniref:hypothetical protein n=1 Tax=Succinatimonas hippei TaxID=626938 RepID=UPI0023F7A4A0|nr:hypothetical protein [Succinatimonas hippei]
MNNTILFINDFYLKKTISNIKNVKDLDYKDTLSDLKNLLCKYQSEEELIDDSTNNDDLLFLYKALKLISLQKDFDWRNWSIANILFDTACPQIAFTYDKSKLQQNEVIADFDIVENMGQISVVIPEHGICIDTKMTLRGKNEKINDTCISQALNEFKTQFC